MTDLKNNVGKKVEIVKMHDGVMEAKFGNELLSILLSPREAGRVHIELLKRNEDKEEDEFVEHYPQRFIGMRAVPNVPFRVNITPRGIEKFNEDDESITYKYGETIWYKAHPEAEPEILVYKGLAIWNYNEFIGDVNEGGELYSLAYNPVSEKIVANKIVSLEGKSYLENPVNSVVSKKYQAILLEDVLEKDVIETAYNIYQGVKKKIEKLRKERESEKQLVGGQPKAVLTKATLWCFENHPRGSEPRRKTILLAYQKFGKETHKQNSFERRVREKWSDLDRQYREQPKEFRKKNSKESYAKDVLKVPRSNSKQKGKEEKSRM